jgi:hypothetical protein
VENTPNPYQAPQADPTPVLTDDDQRSLVATFFVDQRLVYRALRFDMERRTWFRRAVFIASMAALSLLLVCLILQLPFEAALAVMLVFVLLHLAQIVIPHWWTRRRLAECQRTGRWPVLQGEMRVEVAPQALQVAQEGHSRAWRMGQVADAFYLGDMLLICPEPGVLIPVPRGAEFSGGDNFVSFCRLLAIRLKRSERPAGESARH